VSRIAIEIVARARHDERSSALLQSRSVWGCYYRVDVLASAFALPRSLGVVHN
jgi:hypothetical protein